MLEVKNVNLKFTKEYFALCNISCEVEKGETVCLVGQEESGKTSLIRIIAGLESHFTGEVYNLERAINKIDFQYDVSIGYIPAKGVFKEKKSVYDNMVYAATVRDAKSSPYDIQVKADKILEELGMMGIRDQKVHKLSLLERYELSVARLKLRGLDILLVDNIYNHLNAEERMHLIELFKKHFIHTDTTCIFATEEEEIAEALGGRIIRMNYGAIVE